MFVQDAPYFFQIAASDRGVDAVVRDVRIALQQALGGMRVVRPVRPANAPVQACHPQKRGNTFFVGAGEVTTGR